MNLKDKVKVKEELNKLLFDQRNSMDFLDIGCKEKEWEYS
jgi:hypothetical protein